MTQYYINFNLDRENTFVKFLVDLAKNKFTFTLRWNDYCDCFFMDIQNLDGDYILSGRAVVNNLVIRHPDLPFLLYFSHLQGETYEPTIDNISEFGLFYEDNE